VNFPRKKPLLTGLEFGVYEAKNITHKGTQETLLFLPVLELSGRNSQLHREQQFKKSL